MNMKTIDNFLQNLKVGDIIYIGRWKNRKAVIKGFKRDKNNQPVICTDLGDVNAFKFRIQKLMEN